MLLFIFPLIVTLSWLGVEGIPIDNGVIGEPEIQCGPTSITVNFNTQNAFQGHVYVKNLYETDGCRTDESQRGSSFAQIVLPFDTCNTVRTRSLEPKGVFVSNTVVIKFHPTFVTKIDRAIKIQCFYMEADKTVDQDLEVSMITTEFQTINVPMPICRYEILDEDDTGLPVRFALIGQKVYHKWTCDTDTIDTFCMIVYGCFVDDGSGGNVINLLDDQGCATDIHLLGQTEYTSDLMAGVQSHVFKYADRAHLYFNCQVNILVKDPGQDCARPVCSDSTASLGGGGNGGQTVPRGRGRPAPRGRPLGPARRGRQPTRGRPAPRGGRNQLARRRGRRSITDYPTSIATVDVRYPDYILVGDVDLLQNSIPEALLHPANSSEKKVKGNEFCISSSGFAILTCILVIFVVSAISMAAILIAKRSRKAYN